MKIKRGELMSKEENKVSFDLSALSLSELIKVYEDIVNFLEFLNEKKIIEAKEAKANE
jgi:hypothetical protein